MDDLLNPSLCHPNSHPTQPPFQLFSQSSNFGQSTWTTVAPFATPQLDMSSSLAKSFPALMQFSDAKASEDELEQGDVDADLEDEGAILVDPDPEPESLDASIQQVSEGVQNASKGVSESTDQSYRRLINQCAAFLLQRKLISSPEEFFNGHPGPNSPTLIMAWIMHECDTIDFYGKKVINQTRASYTHAQKMRASMTYAFGRIHGLGKQAWQQFRDANSGVIHAAGNPSISEPVSRYMISLHRRKVHDGEAPTSARAITSDILAQLYDINRKPENWTLTSYQPGTRQQQKDINHWGGPKTRRALTAIYTIAFICLLRIDEALKIQVQHLAFGDNGKITLMLPFRKTHQFGDIKAFVLYPLPMWEAHICPVRAIAEWISTSGVTSGYIFRRMYAGDRLSSNNIAMSSEQFLNLFRHNLLDAIVNPAPYGTHSFRRGGCQYLYSERRWGLRTICEWGGWSTDFSNMTIVKYLISWNDDPAQTRDDFFNPKRQPAIKCPVCGRSCTCS